MSNNSQALLWLTDAISKKYNIKDLKEVQIIIRWQVTRDHIARMLKIDQSAFIQDLIKIENMTDCNSINIPIKASYYIEMSEADNYEEVDIKKYQKLIGKLIYLLYNIRPDIAFVIDQLSRHNLDS